MPARVAISYPSTSDARSSRARARSAVDIREQRRQYRHAGVALGEHVAIVRVERVDRGRAGESRTGQARATAVEHEARLALAAAHVRHRMVVCEP